MTKEWLYEGFNEWRGHNKQDHFKKRISDNKIIMDIYYSEKAKEKKGSPCTLSKKSYLP